MYSIYFIKNKKCIVEASFILEKDTFYQIFEKFDLDFPNKWFKHGTTFILPNSSDYLKAKNWPYTKSLIKYKIEHLKSKL